MKTKHMALILILLLVAAVGAWQGIPPIADPDDPHYGQPQWCQNHDDLRGPKNCDCRKSCEKNEPEDSKCKVYCRKDACTCDHGCHT